MIIYKQTPVTLSKTENFRFNKRMERLKQPTVSIPEKRGTEKPAPVREQSKGISVKELAKSFSVNTCSIYRLLKCRNETGSYETQMNFRGKKPKSSDAEHQHILSLLEKQPDATCLEIIEMLNLPVSIDTVWRFLQKAGYRRKKKSLHASEQERPRCGREEEKLERPYMWVQCK